MVGVNSRWVAMIEQRTYRCNFCGWYMSYYDRPKTCPHCLWKGEVVEI